MAIILTGALATLVAIMLALSGSSTARRLLAGASTLIAAILLVAWSFDKFRLGATLFKLEDMLWRFRCQI